MTAVMDVRMSKALPGSEFFSLSQLFLDMANGRSLEAVDAEIKELQHKLSEAVKAGRIRRVAILHEEIIQRQGEHRFITRTMSA